MKNSNFGFFDYTKNFTYNAAGAVTSMQLGNGRWESTSFNPRFQPTQIALGTVQNGTDKLELDFTYGTTANNGNVLTQSINFTGLSHPFIQTYTYDSLNRLDDSNETYDGSQTWRQDFSYDRYGNRNFVESNTSFAGFDKLCNSNTELCAELRKKINPSINTSNNRLNASEDYSFDASGNMTSDPEDRAFIYDAEDRQVEVKNFSGATTGLYAYDGNGKRVKKYVPGTGETTIFVYDIFARLVSEYSTVVVSANEAKVAYLTADQLGSPRINTDQNGNVTARHDYHSFGEEVSTAQRISGYGYTSDSIRNQFTSYERDGETGLDFAQARMYSSSLGRFSVIDPILSSVDPTIPQTWNRYVYCVNNPYRFIDPSGLMWVYQDSADGKIRTFRWYDDEKDVPTGWSPYTGSNYYIGKDEGIFLGAKGKGKKVSLEEAGLGQLTEFLRGPDSPLSAEDKAKLTKAFLQQVRSFHWEDDFIATLAGTSLAVIGEKGLKALAALFTSTTAKVETARLAGMLREAMAGKGNFGIGSATVDQANAMGRAWVGEGYKVASDGVTLISQDGLRQFRPPSFKPDLGKVQANFEWRPANLKQWQGNGHIDIH